MISRLRTSSLSLRIHSDIRTSGAESTPTASGAAVSIPGSGSAATWAIATPTKETCSAIAAAARATRTVGLREQVKMVGAAISVSCDNEKQFGYATHLFSLNAWYR